MTHPQPPVAVILAAGLGKRLGDLTATRPKALLPLAESGVTFLDHSLRLLLPRVEATRVVGGYAYPTLERHVRERYPQAFREGRLGLLEFRDYPTVNNIGTFLAAAPAFARGGLLLNSDIVYHPAILEGAIASCTAAPEQSFLVVDETVALDEEEMKVTVDHGGRVTGINKKLPPDASLGEYIGILHLSANDAQLALQAARDLIAKGGTNLYYEDAVAHALDRIPLQTLSTGGKRWTEVDTPEDYERARGIYANLQKEGVV